MFLSEFGFVFSYLAGDLADLIFVFFDPIGQALCKRTLTLVEQLSEKHAERMRFYLSKADEAGHEGDRQVWRCNLYDAFPKENDYYKYNEMLLLLFIGDYCHHF